MDIISALAISIAALGGIATYLFLSPTGMGLQVWVAFIAWASFYHCGGKEAGLVKAITHNLFGAFLGLILLLLATQVPLGQSIGLPAWAGICVAFTAFIAVIAAKIPTLSDIPVTFLGFASVAGLALAANKAGAITAVSLENPFINVAVSLVIGAVFGYVSEKVGGVLVKN